MKRDLCAVAKLGRKCVDDLCRGADVTLCGFDQDFYDEIVNEADYVRQEDEDEQ
jgi:hypothetical protein